MGEMGKACGMYEGEQKCIRSFGGKASREETELYIASPDLTAVIGPLWCILPSLYYPLQQASCCGARMIHSDV